MTPVSTNTFIRKVKDITISSTLALAILGSSFTLQSCNNDSDSDYEYEEVEVYTKGVKTYIAETSKGVFKITDEVEVPADSSIAIVTYLDGKKDTLSPKAVKALIDDEVRANPTTIGKSDNLSNALLFGGMGYLLAKTLSPNYAQYRPDVTPNSGIAQNHSSKNDTTYRRRHGYYGGGMGMMYYYATAAAFQKSNAIHQNIGHSRTTMSRPVGGKSGFFHSSSHSSHRS
ncbi:hypothetical protein [Emticicia agri]|uniref:UPF0323 domain-containing protein n=1 Tax=Emticicia agri TaxID=2492393 RepID=A0A4V1ZDX6_9BACT|nr:hypothetical protein [Emticicia agri]RYU97690.1 hypothetical protein EWM59_00780 [Emticicia agri]